MVTVTFCTSGMVLKKAGANTSSALTTLFIGSGATAECALDTWITETESLINAVCRYDFTSTYSGLSANTKKILQGVASDLAAIDAINYDMSGYGSRTEAEDMINVRRDSALRGLAILRDKKVQKFISDTSTGNV